MKLVKRYLGVILGLLSLLLFKLFQVFPDFLELIYTTGIYRFIRYVYSYTLTYLPFPLLYVFVLIIILLLVNFFVKKERKKRIIPAALNFLGYIIFVFYWSWGFNYARTDFATRIDLEVSKPNLEFLYAELIKVDSLLVEIRKEIQSFDSIPLGVENMPLNYQEVIRASQVTLIKNLEEPTYRPPKIRELKPNGSLLRIKTAGVYFPFVFEGHIDNGLHPIEKPYVMAHEMAHAHAFTDEGVCNFIGFITCVNAEDPFIQYSGWLEYQGYLYRSLRRNFPEKLKEEAYKLPLAVVTDLRSIRERLDKYPSIAPGLRDLFYNNYLKAQGVHAGIKSYSQITRLAYSYKKKYGGFVK
jgi:hypothetical protein